jgi:hypothetical protein
MASLGVTDLHLILAKKKMWFVHPQWLVWGWPNHPLLPQGWFGNPNNHPSTNFYLLCVVVIWTAHFKWTVQIKGIASCQIQSIDLFLCYTKGNSRVPIRAGIPASMQDVLGLIHVKGLQSVKASLVEMLFAWLYTPDYIGVYILYICKWSYYIYASDVLIN